MWRGYSPLSTSPSSGPQYCDANPLLFGESVALLVARRTNNRNVVGSKPAKVVCITVLTGNRLG